MAAVDINTEIGKSFYVSFRGASRSPKSTEPETTRFVKGQHKFLGQSTRFFPAA